MNKLSFAIIFLWFLAGCDYHEDEFPDASETEFSPCVQSLIASLESQDERSTPAQIWLITSGMRVYYYVPADCCDRYSVLYDTKCNIVCHPDGGIGGTGDDKCPSVDLSNRKLLWQGPGV